MLQTWNRTGIKWIAKKKGSSTIGQHIRVLVRYTSSSGDKRPKRPEKIVLVGAGWAAFRFLKDIKKQKYDVTVISPRNHFLFTPLLASTTTGTLDFRSIIEPIRTRNKDVTFYHASCSDIDPKNQTIKCEGYHSDQAPFYCSYDWLVIALGAANNTYDIPGVREHTQFLKELADARAIRTRIIECFELASHPNTPPEKRRELLNFVIVGGGPTGVEFAAELSDFFWEDLNKYFPNVPINEVRITLLEASDKILGAFAQTLVNYALKKN